MTSPPSPTAPERFRVPGLDGIRALAVTTVIVFHLLPGTLIGGYLGVDIFFVVSGFLITMLLVRERAATGRISLRGFWARRARRLLPALGLLLLACCTAALVVGGDVLVGLGLQVIGAITFSSNWVFIAQGSSYFGETVPELFRNLWSLAVEEQFYVVWPLLVVVLLVRIPRWARLLLIAALAVASAAWMAVSVPADATTFDPTRVYYGTDTHAFGLALGAFLAVLLHDRGIAGHGMAGRGVRVTLGLGGTVAIAGLLALAVVLPGDSPLAYRGGLALVAVLSAVAIAALLVPGSLLARVLDVAPIRWIGLRSYGLYLWHWPVFVLVGAVLPTWPREGFEAWPLGAIALAITVVAAALSYRFLEQPIRRHGFRGTARAILDAAPRSRRAFGALTAMVLAAVLAGASTIALVADPGRGEVQGYIEAGQEAIDNAGAPTPTPAPVGEEADDHITTGDEILALGDSVLLAAAPALQERYPGIVIDATVSRQMAAAPALVASYMDADALRPVVVLALGTNGPIDRATLEEVRQMIGPKRELVVVNTQTPRGWTPAVNSELASFALVYRNVELANWYDAIQPYLHEMARDQVHFGPIGAGIFTATVSDAVDRLAALPPLRDDSTSLSVPTPF